MAKTVNSSLVLEIVAEVVLRNDLISPQQHVIPAAQLQLLH